MLRPAAPIKIAMVIAVASTMIARCAAAAANIKSSTTRPVQKRANRQPPSAEQLRGLMDNMPFSDGMSDGEKENVVEGYLRARGGRTGPIWENHTHAERTANLHRHHSRRAWVVEKISRRGTLIH